MDYHGSSFAALISASGAVREYETGPRRSRVATFHTSPTVVPSAGPTWRRGDTEFHCTSKLGMAKEATLGYVRLRQVTSGYVRLRQVTSKLGMAAAASAIAFGSAAAFALRSAAKMPSAAIKSCGNRPMGSMAGRSFLAVCTARALHTRRESKGHQGPSRAIKGNQGQSRATRRESKGTCACERWARMRPARAIKRHQGPSRVIKGHQGRRSASQVHLEGTRRTGSSS